MPDAVALDGSYGEGGGQILRTALALSAMQGRALRVDNIRAGRSKPGLRPQHLAALRAMARLCDARVDGDEVGSRSITFVPNSPPRAGQYTFDIAAMAGSGSAGSATLLFQTLALPLAFCQEPSTLRLMGGTHVRWSPPYHYLTQVYLPLVASIGFEAHLELGQWGWYPRGGGEIVAHIAGSGCRPQRFTPLQMSERGKLIEVLGISAASNLPEHIVRRQAARAVQRLRARHIKARIERVMAPSPGPGTGLFLLAQYERVAAGFTGYGRIRYPAEKVADDAVKGFEAHLASKAALDPYLADQVLLPLALVPGPSHYTTSRVTRHLLTVQWVLQEFIEREIRIEGEEGSPGQVTLH